MQVKRLLNRYTLFFFLSICILTLFLKTLESKKEEEFFKKNNSKIEKIYSNYLINMKELSQILFFNHIAGNKELLKLLKDENAKSVDIDNLLKEQSSFYKLYNIKEISIYSKELKPLYNSILKDKNFNLDPSYKQLLENFKKSGKEFFDIGISNTSASLKFLKSIYDENYNFAGIFESSIDLPKLSHKIFLNESLMIDFIFEKSLLNRRLNSQALKDYYPYRYNSLYLFEKSFYNNRKTSFETANDINGEELKNKMNNNKSFSIIYDNENSKYIKSFIPILNPYTKEKIGYLLVTKDAKEYLDITNKYNLIMFITILLLLISFTLLYLYNKRKKRYIDSQTKLESILKSIDKYVIIVETDLKGIATYASQAFCDISGYKKREIIGKPLSIIRNPDISKRFFEKMWEKISKNEVWEGEIKNLDKNGNSYWERGSITPIFNQEKKIIGYRSIKVDITDEKQLQKVNSLLKKELFSKLNEIKTMDRLNIDESKIKLMSQILDTFSNEWKKPISNINSSILEFENRVDKARYTKKELKEFLQLLREEIKYLSINLNEFRKLFIQSDKNDKYNVYEVVKSVIDSIYEENISINLKGNSNIQTYGIFYDLKKVILGIVTNSLDAFKTKEIKEGKIDINLLDDEDSILIKIEDNAGGIPKEIIPKIFDYNFSTKYYTKVEGLPLYLAKLIIEKSNGEIWVENINNGCCFFIKLDKKDRRVKRREEI